MSENEVVPDSEEEELRRTKRLPPSQSEVIDILSSDEECAQVQRQELRDYDPFIENGKMPGSWPDRSKAHDAATSPSPIKAKPRKVQTARSRRIIQSSESEVSDSQPTAPRREAEVIVLSDSSPERRPKPKPIPKNQNLKTARPALPKSSLSAPEPIAPLYADEEPWNIDDGSILTLDEAGGSRKPIRRAPASNGQTIGPSISQPGNSEAGLLDSDSDSDSGLLQSTRTPANKLRLKQANPPSAGSPAKATRVTKKAQAAAEQARREQYAEGLFTELNQVVFKEGLPKETKLVWNKRLLTTAGRAKWHRSREGVQTTEIELAMKILDSDERIRNTLSHEMCHLACWIINADPKEGHGKVWKAWAAKVERKRPDIEVTTKHNYEISYPYEWECAQCSKIYGRFSKSIRPDECVCGACKIGKLVPQFAEKAPKTPKSKVASRMAPEKTQGSPCAVPLPPATSPSSLTPGTSISHRTPARRDKVYSLDSSDSGSEVEILAVALGGVKIAA